MLTLQNRELYDEIIAGDHWFEWRLVIGDGLWANAHNLYGDDILSISTEYKMFDGDAVEVGKCIASELTATIYNPDFEIPRMCLIRPLVRATNGEQSSEWIRQGYYYIDTREITHNSDGLDILSFHCYDAMLKAEAPYPSTTHAWPANALQVTQDIADAMGVGIDGRTTAFLQPRTWAFMGLPVGYTMREVLTQLGNRLAGNWVITYEGNLMLIPIGSIPKETNYLVTPQSEAITFGGDRILV